jgi:uncharacterized protein YkwD
MKHVAMLAAAALLTYCQTPPQPSANLSPLMMPVSPLASPALEPQALLINLQVAEPPVEPALSCGLNAQADAMARLVKDADWQERKPLLCDYRLVYAAQSKAEAMAKGNWFSHDDPTTGESPNELVKRFGCTHGYGDGNSVESLVAGSPSPKLSLDWLYRSEAHRRHLAGEGWFSGQDRYGVGFAQTANGASYYQFYWVLVFAECE